MTAPEEGVLLLCCALGQRDAAPLSAAQFQALGEKIRQTGLRRDEMQNVSARDLIQVGCSEAFAQRVMRLLDREASLSRYLHAAAQLDIFPLTRISRGYPQRLREKLRHGAPPVLFCRGDIALFTRPAVAVVGSRRLYPKNEAFARLVGALAAKEGFALVSGGALGADQIAQEAALARGGSALIFPADALQTHVPPPDCLYCSAEGYELPFSAARALYRNKLIHAQGDLTLVAQCSLASGGTWQGCQENLRHSWSDLYVFEDRSPAAAALIEQGATAVEALQSIRALSPAQLRLE